MSSEFNTGKTSLEENVPIASDLNEKVFLGCQSKEPRATNSSTGATDGDSCWWRAPHYLHASLGWAAAVCQAQEQLSLESIKGTLSTPSGPRGASLWWSPLSQDIRMRRTFFCGTGTFTQGLMHEHSTAELQP